MARASGAPRTARSCSTSAPRSWPAASRRSRAGHLPRSTPTGCTSAAATWKRRTQPRRARRTSGRWSWTPGTPERTSTWAGSCTRQGKQPALPSTTGARSRRGPRTARLPSTWASPWRTWAGGPRPSTRTGWRSPPIRTAPTRTTTCRVSTSTSGRERRPFATSARTGRPPATPDADAVRDERLQLRALAGNVLSGGPAEIEDAPVLRVAFRHGRDQLQLLPQTHREAPRGLGGTGAGALPLRAQGVATHHPPHQAAGAGAGRGVRGDGEIARTSACTHPLPTAAEPEIRRSPAPGIPPAPAARSAGGVRVPPSELVQRRDVPRSAGFRSGPVPGGER